MQGCYIEDAYESTARRWHDKAIARVVVPDNAIKI